VTVPISFAPGVLQTTLQSTLSSLSAAVQTGTEGLSNSSIVGGAVTTPSILELSNVDSTGASTGNYSGSFTVPSGYNALVVEVTGSETITGSSSVNLALFGANSTVNYTQTSGNASVFASGNDNVVLGGLSYSVVGGTVGGNSFAVLSDEGFVTTEASSASNIVFVAGQADSVVSNGSNDIIASGATAGSITVSGFANYIGTSGSDTITAVGTGSIHGLIDSGYAGSIYFINNSTSASTISGFSGSITVFAGAGGGHYEGGGDGHNFLEGQAGLVTLVGSSAGNDTLIAGGNSTTGMNILQGSNSIESGGNQTLISESTAGSTLFVLNAGADQVSASGTGNQQFVLSDTGYATITGSTTSGAVNQYVLAQTSTQGGNNDYIKNFSLTRDSFSLIDPGVSISGVTNGDNLGGDVTGSVVSLSNGTTIKLVGVTWTADQIASVHGGTSF